MVFSQVPQYIVSGITSGSIYALIALGFSLVHNATGIINFAQGEFVMLGALITISGVKDFGLSMWNSSILAILMVTLVGLGLEKGPLRRSKTSSPLILIMITVGLSITLQGIGMIVWGKDVRTLPPVGGYNYIRFLNASIIPQTILIIVVVAILLFLLYLFFHKTVLGKAVRAVSENPEGAYLIGIPVKRLIMLSFGLSGAIGALAGILVTPLTTMSYQSGLMLGLKGFASAVLGGFSSIAGSVVGGFLLGLMESFGAGFISSTYKDAIAFFVLLSILFLRPSGIFGNVKMRKV